MPECSPSLGSPSNGIRLRAIDYNNWNHTLILITLHIFHLPSCQNSVESERTISALKEKMCKTEWKPTSVCCQANAVMTPTVPSPEDQGRQWRWSTVYAELKGGLLIPRPPSLYLQVLEEPHNAKVMGEEHSFRTNLAWLTFPAPPCPVQLLYKTGSQKCQAD